MGGGINAGYKKLARLVNLEKSWLVGDCEEHL